MGTSLATVFNMIHRSEGSWDGQGTFVVVDSVNIYGQFNWLKCKRPRCSGRIPDLSLVEVAIRHLNNVVNPTTGPDSQHDPRILQQGY